MSSTHRNAGGTGVRAAARACEPDADHGERLRVVLAGGGHAHLAVLDDWARSELAGTERILVTPHARMPYSGMVPGWIEGLYRRDELEIDLAPLAAAAGARLVIGEVIALDARARRLSLASGAVLDYDRLSLAVGGAPDLTPFAGVEALLPIRPIGRFLGAWSAIERDCPTRIAVVGGGAAGVELALAIAARFPGMAGKGALVLIAGAAGLLEGHARPVRARAAAALARRGVEVLDIDVQAAPGGLTLPRRGVVAFDAVVAATGSLPPAWLADSGLELGPGGGIAVSSEMRSVSDPYVWAAGDMSERTDRPLARSGVHAVKSGPVLAANLRAAVQGGQSRRYNPRARTLYLLSMGEQRAILSWGRWSLEGNWVWRLKNWIDRRFIARYQRQNPAPGPGSHEAGGK